MKMRCIFMILVALVTLGISKVRTETWEEYQTAFKVDKFNSVYNYYHKQTYASEHVVRTFTYQGKRTRLPAIGNIMLLLTKDTKSYWFKSHSFVTMYLFCHGSPLKLSNLNANGTITVRYLGNKLHPLCRNLNCQHELVYKLNDVIKKELVDPNGFSLIIAILAPLPPGEEKGLEFIPETDLRYKLES